MPQNSPIQNLNSKTIKDSALINICWVKVSSPGPGKVPDCKRLAKSNNLEWELNANAIKTQVL